MLLFYIMLSVDDVSFLLQANATYGVLAEQTLTTLTDLY